MNTETGKRQYIILTSRIEYQRCRYLVDAQTIEAASLLFEHGRVDCSDANVIDAEEEIEEVVAAEKLFTDATTIGIKS